LDGARKNENLESVMTFRYWNHDKKNVKDKMKSLGKEVHKSKVDLTA